MLKRTFLLLMAMVLTLAGHATAASPDADGITRIPIECEDMQGVKWGPEGFTKEWTAGQWGRDLHQNMIFGGVWSSRMANAVTDASDTPAEVFQDVTIPSAGKYKVWAKYEVPPFFNYPFGVRIETLGSDGKPAGQAIFDKVYGLRDSLKHFSFNKKLKSGDLFWNWGMDHDAAEGYETELPAGKVRVTLYKAKGPAGAPVGARSVDAILITSLISTLSNGDAKTDFNNFPLIEQLMCANHVYARFKNNGTQPVLITYSHWNHRATYYYQIDPQKAVMVRFFGADGKIVLNDKGEPRTHPKGQWTEPVAPGATTPWIDIGPTMTTENSCPFFVQAALPAEPGKQVLGYPLAMDLASEPADSKILKSFAMDAGEPQLDVLIQPDLHRKEGVETTDKTVNVFRRVTKLLDTFPRVGPMPKKLKLYGTIGIGYLGPLTATRPDFPVTMDYAIALGLNTVPVNPADVDLIDAAKSYYASKNAPFVEMSAKYHHTQDVELVRKKLSEPEIARRLYYVSYGDEIGLPRIDVKDEHKLQQFRAFLQARGVKPSELGAESYDTIKPLTSYTANVAVQIGVLPAPTDGTAAKLPEGDAGRYIKRLYWLSSQFAIQQGIDDFAEKTRILTAMIGPHFKTTANLGGMHPYYWMHQSSFIESFRGNAMTLAWSEDYDYCQPEVTRLVIDWQAAYLRAGAKYHDTPMMFYCMPHYPGNSGQHLIQNAVTLWGQGVQDLDFFNSGIDAYGTENYIHSRGGHAETGRAMRQISGMAGNIEDALIPARTKQARIAVLLSETSDVWETNGQGQGVIAPGTPESNISQEERKNIWYCLRNNGYLVDVLTENDVAEGRLKDYAALYVCGHNLDQRTVKPITDWVTGGGRLFLTAGAARRNEYDEPLTDLDNWLGRNAEDPHAVFYGGPMRAKLELLQVPVLDSVSFKLPGGDAAGSFDVIGSREVLNVASGAEVLGTYQDHKPALVSKAMGKGVVYQSGSLPGQAYVRKGLMPAQPMGKGGPEWNFSQWEPLNYDANAAKVILLAVSNLAPEAKADRAGIVTNILQSKTHTLITLINLAKYQDGIAKDVVITVPGLRAVKGVTTAMKRKVSIDAADKGSAVLRLDQLDDADVIVIEH